MVERSTPGRDDESGRSIDIPGAWNVRSVGGGTSALIRSSTLAHLDIAGQQRMHDLGIRVVFDLRYTSEIESSGSDRVPTSVAVRHTPFDSDRTSAPLHEAPSLSSDEGRTDYMVTHYRLFPSLEGASRAILEVAEVLAAESEGGVLVHCAAGKDRTGWLCAVILAAAGYSRRAIMDDYLYSNHALEDLRIRTAARNPDADVSALLLGVRPGYLEAAFDDVRNSFGSVDAYLDAIGFTPALRQTLRSRLS